MFHRLAIACLALAAGTIFGGFTAADENLSQDPAQSQTMTKEHQATSEDKTLVLQASELIGLEVRNTRNEDVGQVNDLIVNLKQGKITHVLVSSGGVVGVGDRILPIPLGAAKFGEETGESKEWLMVVNLPSGNFENAPALEGDTLPNFGDADWTTKLNDYYQIEATKSGDMAAPAGDIQPGDTAEPKDVTDSRNTLDSGVAVASDFKRCSDLIGAAVMNYTLEDADQTDTANADADADVEKESIGEIREIVFSAEDGTIRYAALSFGGFMGFGEKLFALPWETLAFSTPADDSSELHLTLTVSVNKERLEELQGFNAENWPRQADMRWIEGARRVVERPDTPEKILE